MGRDPFTRIRPAVNESGDIRFAVGMRFRFPAGRGRGRNATPPKFQIAD